MRSFIKHTKRTGLVLGHGASVNKISRISSVVFATTILAISIVSQPYVLLKPRYNLDQTAYKLIGESRDDAAQYMSLSKDGSSYNFEVPKANEDGQSLHTGRVEDAYSANLSLDAKKGITVTEKKTSIGVTVIPEFHTNSGQKVEGDHVVYPSGADKLVYTLKYNGLKEDIIVPEFRRNELSYKFTLRLPSGVEARLDEGGNIGIYSSDPVLFGNISYGSDEDRAKVEKARENGEKTNLVMTIPYPIIKDSTGTEHTNKASFELGDKKQTQNKETPSDLPAELPRSLITNNDYTLTIKARSLEQLSYPIAIDPTVQVASSSDFANTTQESGVEVDYTNNLIKRSGLSGGTHGSWATDDTTLPYGTARHQTAYYNGYIYMFGGINGSTNLYYATMNESTGDIGNFSLLTNTGNTRSYFYMQAVNGYLYLVGAANKNHPGSVNNPVATQYAKINANGTLGSFTSSTTPSARLIPGLTYSNGYFYMIGGCSAYNNALDQFDCTTLTNTVQYAQVNADGSLGSWQTTTNIPATRAAMGVATYNGYMYVVGGEDINEAGTTTVYYGKQNADGTVSSWITSTSLPSSNDEHVLLAHKGYLYMVGGQAGDAAATRYAALNADGSVAQWRSTTQLGAVYREPHAIAVGSRIVFSGGATGGVGQTTVFVASIDSPGVLHNGTWSSGTSVVSAVYSFGKASVVYNGYIYFTGGIKTSGASLAEAQYAPLNADGSIGAWATTTSMNTGRQGHRLVAYDGYLYALAGCTSGVIGVSCSSYTSGTERAQLNANGTIASWTNDAAITGGARALHGATVYNGYIYVIGGNAGGTEFSQINSSTHALGTWASTTHMTGSNVGVAFNGYFYAANTVTGVVQVATINSNGTLNVFNDANAADMQTPHVATLPLFTVIKGYLYIIGQSNGGNGVEYTRINNDGTLAGWSYTREPSVSGDSLTTSTDGNAFYIINNDGTTQYQHINNGGSGQISGWTQQANTFTSARAHHDTLAYNGYLYVIGGNTSVIPTTVTTSIQYAPIGGQGTLGSWAATTVSLPETQNVRAELRGNMIYIVMQTKTFYYNTIQSNGDISTAWTAAVSVPAVISEIAHAETILYNDAIYVLGGHAPGSPGSPTTETFYIELQPSGLPSVSGWQTGTTLPTARARMGVTAARGRLYVVGGCLASACSDGSGASSNAISAPLDSTSHAIGTWRTENSLPIASTYGELEFYNGYFYYSVVQNTTTGDSTPIVQSYLYAVLLSDGTFGEWTSGSKESAHLHGESRFIAGSAIYNGYYYITGGRDTGVALRNTVEKTNLQTIPRTGSFARVYDFNSGARPTKLITRGTKHDSAIVSVTQSSNVACNNATYDNATTTTKIGYTGANVLNLSLGSSRTLARCFMLRYTIDDTYSAVFPDTGNETSIAAFDLYFIANPGGRLRGGQTFTDGLNRGLDAQPQ